MISVGAARSSPKPPGVDRAHLGCHRAQGGYGKSAGRSRVGLPVRQALGFKAAPEVGERTRYEITP